MAKKVRLVGCKIIKHQPIVTRYAIYPGPEIVTRYAVVRPPIVSPDKVEIVCDDIKMENVQLEMDENN